MITGQNKMDTHDIVTFLSPFFCVANQICSILKIEKVYLLKDILIYFYDYFANQIFSLSDLPEHID